MADLEKAVEEAKDQLTEEKNEAEDADFDNTPAEENRKDS
jgi:hypothetical protein